MKSFAYVLAFFVFVLLFAGFSSASFWGVGQIAGVGGLSVQLQGATSDMGLTYAGLVVTNPSGVWKEVFVSSNSVMQFDGLVFSVGVVNYSGADLNVSSGVLPGVSFSEYSAGQTWSFNGSVFEFLGARFYGNVPPFVKYAIISVNGSDFLITENSSSVIDGVSVSVGVLDVGYTNASGDAELNFSAAGSVLVGNVSSSSIPANALYVGQGLTASNGVLVHLDYISTANGVYAVFYATNTDGSVRVVTVYGNSSASIYGVTINVGQIVTNPVLGAQYAVVTLSAGVSQSNSSSNSSQSNFSQATNSSQVNSTITSLTLGRESNYNPQMYVGQSMTASNGVVVALNSVSGSSASFNVKSAVGMGQVVVIGQNSYYSVDGIMIHVGKVYPGLTSGVQYAEVSLITKQMVLSANGGTIIGSENYGDWQSVFKTSMNGNSEAVSKIVVYSQDLINGVQPNSAPSGYSLITGDPVFNFAEGNLMGPNGGVSYSPIVFAIVPDFAVRVSQNGCTGTLSFNAVQIATSPHVFNGYPAPILFDSSPSGLPGTSTTFSTGYLAYSDIGAISDNASCSISNATVGDVYYQPGGSMFYYGDNASNVQLRYDFQPNVTAYPTFSYQNNMLGINESTESPETDFNAEIQVGVNVSQNFLTGVFYTDPSGGPTVYSTTRVGQGFVTNRGSLISSVSVDSVAINYSNVLQGLVYSLSTNGVGYQLEGLIDSYLGSDYATAALTPASRSSGSFVSGLNSMLSSGFDSVNARIPSSTSISVPFLAQSDVISVGGNTLSESEHVYAGADNSFSTSKNSLNSNGMGAYYVASFAPGLPLCANTAFNVAGCDASGGLNLINDSRTVIDFLGQKWVVLGFSVSSSSQSSPVNVSPHFSVNNSLNVSPSFPVNVTPSFPVSTTTGPISILIPQDWQQVTYQIPTKILCAFFSGDLYPTATVNIATNAIAGDIDSSNDPSADGAIISVCVSQPSSLENMSGIFQLNANEYPATTSLQSLNIGGFDGEMLVSTNTSYIVWPYHSLTLVEAFENTSSSNQIFITGVATPDFSKELLSAVNAIAGGINYSGGLSLNVSPGLPVINSSAPLLVNVSPSAPVVNVSVNSSISPGFGVQNSSVVSNSSVSRGGLVEAVGKFVEGIVEWIHHF